MDDRGMEDRVVGQQGFQARHIVRAHEQMPCFEYLTGHHAPWLLF
jgi:hypothetical protein